MMARSSNVDVFPQRYGVELGTLSASAPKYAADFHEIEQLEWLDY